MLDKLSLTSQMHISKEMASKQLQGYFAETITTASKYHEQIFVFYRGSRKEGEVLISLSTKPRIAGAAPLKIELNPSRFSSFAALTELIQKIDKPEELKISRVDHAVDITNNIDEINSSLIFSRKKYRAEYKNGRDLTGFYLGAYPEVLVVYDKFKQTGNGTPRTRVELRQHSHKTPITFYYELPKLITCRPFQKLRFAKVKDVELFSDRNAAKHRFLKEAIYALGAQGAFKTFNKHSNFNRDFGSLLEENTAIPNLDAIYQEELRHFFNQGVTNDNRQAT